MGEALVTGWPRCARCNCPVERMWRDRDLQRDELILRAECHGAVEETRITAFQLLNAVRIECTLAFEQPWLGGS